MSCPSCGATNPDHARWCGQCYAEFAREGAGGGALSVAAVADAPSADPVAAPGGGVQALTGGFRRRDGQIEWPCAVCDEFNSMDVLACAVCATPLAQRYAPPPAVTARDWNSARRVSMLAPGAGHWRTGHRGAGIGRALLFAVWLAGGLLTLLAGPRALPAALPLLAGAATVWALTLLDLGRLRNGRPEVLTGRLLLWLVVAVPGLAAIGAVVAIAAAGGAP